MFAALVIAVNPKLLREEPQKEQNLRRSLIIAVTGWRMTRDWRSILQTWQSAEILDRAGWSCRSVCRTMDVWADFKQWQDDTEPDRQRAADRLHGTTMLPRNLLLVFLFPLPPSFMCFGTSATYDSRVNSRTVRTLLSTPSTSETSQGQ